MEIQSTPTGLRKALNTVAAFISTYRYFAFVVLVLLISYFGFIRPANKEVDRLAAKNKQLTSDNALMKEILRPDCPGDSTGR